MALAFEKLIVDEASIRYQRNTEVLWRLEMDEIRIIGEYTNPFGPWADDYFICFVKDSSGWFEASFYADGADEVRQALCIHFDTLLE